MISPDRQEQEDKAQKVSLVEAAGHIENEIEIPSAQLGASKWEELINLASQNSQTGREFGITVSILRGKILTSEIFSGPEAKDEHIKPQVKFPTFPHGFLKAIQLPQTIALVHTHQEPDHEPGNWSNRPSKSDIRTFLELGSRAWVILHRDGVNVLLVTKREQMIGITSREIAEKAYENVNTDENPQMQRAQIAKNLASFGIRYFFSKSIAPTPQNTISLADTRIPSRKV